MKFIKNMLQKLRKSFSFEEGIDITDNTAVLQRKNIVIKNIIFLSNMAYTVILFVVSFISPSPSNWVITIVLLPFTFLLNKTLKKFIKEKDDHIKQQIAMYIATFYMFLSSILIYFKLKTGAPEISEAGYILIYYSLVVVSLYQNKKMMSSVYAWMFIIVSFLHFTTTYAIQNEAYATDLQAFINGFFTSPAFKDIALRTMLLLVFMVVVYSHVEIGQYLFEQRQKEATKRVGVETDFSEVVGELFTTILDMRYSSEDEVKHAELVGQISKRLAGLLGMSPDDYENIYNYATVHMREKDTIAKIKKSDSEYIVVRKQAEIGSQIVKRIQLSQKCDDIVRYHIEGWANKEFTKRMNRIQNEYSSQIILMADLYVTLRTAKPYKRPYNQNQAIEALDREIHIYVNESIYDKFIKYIDDFEAIYNR